MSHQIRRNFQLPKTLDERLRQASQIAGKPMSEIIRAGILKETKSIIKNGKEQV